MYEEDSFPFSEFLLFEKVNLRVGYMHIIICADYFQGINELTHNNELKRTF